MSGWPTPIQMASALKISPGLARAWTFSLL